MAIKLEHDKRERERERERERASKCLPGVTSLLAGRLRDSSRAIEVAILKKIERERIVFGRAERKRCHAWTTDRTSLLKFRNASRSDPFGTGRCSFLLIEITINNTSASIRSRRFFPSKRRSMVKERAPRGPAQKSWAA